MDVILNKITRIHTYYSNNFLSVLKTIDFNPLKKLELFKQSKLRIEGEKKIIKLVSKFQLF